MGKRESVPNSVRWQVLARDGFCCRYCGIPAGVNGATLHVDHIVAVHLGGDSGHENLITACDRCNSGKAVRPMDPDVISLVREGMKLRSNEIRLEAELCARPAHDPVLSISDVARMKCDAYGMPECSVHKLEARAVIGLCEEFRPETVHGWYMTACMDRVPASIAIRYVMGLAKVARANAPEAIHA